MPAGGSAQPLKNEPSSPESAQRAALDLLHTLSLFSGVPDPVLVDLASALEPIELETDEVLFEKGSDGDSLYIIRHGEVRVVSEGVEGRELVINTYAEGEIVGEMSVIDGEPRSAGVIANSPTALYRLGRDAFMELARVHNDLALQVMENLSHRLRFTSTYLQQAIAWSHAIANGDYTAARQQIADIRDQDQTLHQLNVMRAGNFLAAFFEMVDQVQAREQDLKRQIFEFQVQIDAAQKHEQVEAVVNSSFFQQLRRKSPGRTNGPKQDVSGTDHGGGG
jgi:CRP-like cAMP-binding protein